jgi:hypothetical protein
MNQSEILAMRNAQEAAMQDYCTIYPFSSWKMNSAGDQTDKNFGTEFDTKCGFEPTFLQNRRGKAQGEYLETIDFDAVIRLPWSIEIKPLDEILITERFGQEFGGKRYEVVKAEAIGISAKRVMVSAK